MPFGEHESDSRRHMQERMKNMKNAGQTIRHITKLVKEDPGSKGVTCAFSFFDDEAGCALGNTQFFKVCTVSSSQLCLICELTMVEGVCMDQIFGVDAPKKLLEFL